MKAFFFFSLLLSSLFVCVSAMAAPKAATNAGTSPAEFPQGESAEIQRMNRHARALGQQLGKQTRVRVWDYYDLSSPVLPKDLQQVVAYFKQEYNEDVTPVRIVLLKGRLSEPAKFLRLRDFRKIYGTEDLVLVQAEIFQKLRVGLMPLIVHELRHRQDRLNEHPSSKMDTEQVEALQKPEHMQEVADREVEEMLESSAFKKYLKALDVYYERHEPELKEDQKAAKKVEIRRAILIELVQHTIQMELSTGTDFEKRGIWEQARYARIGQKVSREKYLKAILEDIPLEWRKLDEEELSLEGSYVDVEGERVSIDIRPPLRLLIRLHGEAFDRGEKLSAD